MMAASGSIDQDGSNAMRVGLMPESVTARFVVGLSAHYDAKQAT
jgi:hypothetical protein